MTAGLIVLFFLAFYLILVPQWRLPAHPVWNWLGRLTYPLYLLHGLGAGLLAPLKDKVNSHLLLGVSIAAVLLLAWAAHALVERPLSRRLGQWLTHLLARRRHAAQLPVNV